MPLGLMAAALKHDILAQGGRTVGTPPPAGVGAPPAFTPAVTLSSCYLSRTSYECDLF